MITRSRHTRNKTPYRFCNDIKKEQNKYDEQFQIRNRKPTLSNFYIPV